MSDLMRSSGFLTRANPRNRLSRNETDRNSSKQAITLKKVSQQALGFL